MRQAFVRFDDFFPKRSRLEVGQNKMPWPGLNPGFLQPSLQRQDMGRSPDGFSKVFLAIGVLQYQPAGQPCVRSEDRGSLRNGVDHRRGIKGFVKPRPRPWKWSLFSR